MPRKQRLLMGLGVLSLCTVSAPSHDVVSVADSVSPLVTDEAPAAGTLLRVADFGAVGDGVHDDGPAIAAAFDAAKEDGGPSTVVFEKKTYRLGDNPAAWHYFQMEDHEDLVIEGNGATLLCSEGNLAFFFHGGRNITVRGLVFDMTEPTFTQGEVVAVDPGGTLDVKIMDGYPEPPDEAFLAANKHRAHGGGGRHMIVFEKGGGARNTELGSDHLYIRNITRVTPGVFRFHVEEDYLPAFHGVAVGNWVSYGFNKVNLPAAVVAAKDHSACTYAQIAADRVENFTVEEIGIFGSLNGGIRVSDMHDDVKLRDVRIIRKPGSRNLLSTISDALHLMNIRGDLTIEGCVVESPGDDCLNVGTLMERIVAVSEDDPKAMTLRTTDNRYYYYTVRCGDRLQFLDTRTKRDLGIATVSQVKSAPWNRTHRIVLDREVPDLDPASVLVLNLNQMTSSSVIRDNTMTPYMRNAMLVRAHNMTVERNRLIGSHGGVIGLNLSYSMGESARFRNIRVADNTISGFEGMGLVILNPYRDGGGLPDARDVRIDGNLFELNSAKAIRVSGVKGLSVRGNRCMKDGRPVEDLSEFSIISGCDDVVLEPGETANGKEGASE